MPKVSIIILTYNSAKYIKKLVESIYEQNKGLDFEVIIADNASTDNTIAIIKKIEHKINFVSNGGNFGFAKGINLGTKHAKGEYFLFINPDAEFKEGSVMNMLSVFESDDRVGVVGGKLLDSLGKPEKSAGKFFGLLASILIAFGLDEKFGVRFSPNKICKVDFVSGGFMMASRNLWEKIGGFDENFFMYVEDMEFCYRVHFAGQLTYFTPDVSILHEAHGSSNKGFAIKNIYRGILYFHKKHGTAFSYWVIRILFFGKALTLVLAGKIMNNKYLVETYSAALKV